jgi:hypothetical protein
VSGGYAAEIAVPVAYLDQKQGQPWSAIRLNLAVDDADGPAEPAQLWLQPDWRSQENIPGSGTILRRSGPAEAPTRQPAP